MPKIVLGWQLKRPVEDEEIHCLIARVKDRYQGLFADPLEHRGLWQDHQGLLSFDIQAAADRGLHITENRIICLTGQPSITDGARDAGASRLDALSLHRYVTGEGSARQVNPPFTLCWFDKDRKSLRVIHDGLGMDSFFIAEIGGAVVFSNKCWCILELLGETPRIDYTAWRYWFCMGWFPEKSTPFQNIRYLDKGEDITADGRDVVMRQDDALAAWAADGSRARQELQAQQELMERSETSFRKLILENRGANRQYHADLTGGIDSRAICSVLLKEGVPCSFSTSGARSSPDVVIARQLAKEFHLGWERRRETPTGRDTRILDQQFRKMTLWGEGMVEPNRFASYEEHPAARQHDPRLGGGSAEISKGHFYAQALLTRPGRSYRECEERLLDYFGWIADSVLTDRESAALKATLRDQISGGRAYGLQDFNLLDCFYIGHRTRRWQSAHLAADLFDVTILPFINIEHVKLGLAMSPAGKAARGFQKFVIQRNAERLLRIPFNQPPESGLLWKVAAKASAILGRPKDIGSADYFQSCGAGFIQRVTSLEAPLETILDLEKRKEAQGWLRLGNEDWYFYLRLISFCYWHDQYVGKGAAVGTVVWP